MIGFSCRFSALISLVVTMLFFNGFSAQDFAAGCDTNCRKWTVYSKISDSEGNFTNELENGHLWGSQVEDIGDLDGDGNVDFVVGSTRDDDGGVESGAFWILFMNTAGTVREFQKISALEGGFTGVISSTEHWAGAISNLGDINGDGVTDLGIGQYDDNDGGVRIGSYWILFLNADGTVQAHQKIGASSGGLEGVISTGNQFGHSSSAIGDFNGDDIPDVVVGASNDHGNGFQRGAVYLLFLNADGTVSDYRKIGDGTGGFTGTLNDADKFGRRVRMIADLDANGVNELAVVSRFDDDGVTDLGALWILFMNADGTVSDQQKISAAAGGLDYDFSPGDMFGNFLDVLPDMNCDGVRDLAVGSVNSAAHGSVFILYMNRDGTVSGYDLLDGGSLGAGIESGDNFGIAGSLVGDFNGDAFPEMVVGASLDDDGGQDRGAVYILSFTDTCRIECSSGTFRSYEICAGDTLRLEAGSGNSYNWTPGTALSDSSVRDPLAFPVTDIEYIADYTDDMGCTARDTVSVSVRPEEACSCSYFLPNAFSPNGDDLNDVFRLVYHSLAAVEIVVYDRWGEEVFRSADPGFAWMGDGPDGRPLSADVFGFSLRGTCPDGTVVDLQGNVSLIR